MAKIQHGRDLSAKEMGEILDEWVNAHSDKKDREDLADQIVNRTHRTLQHGIMGAFITVIEKWASVSTFDARNEATIKLAKKIIESTGDKYDRMLPYV